MSEAGVSMKKKLIISIRALELMIAGFDLPPFTGGPSADHLKVENASEFKTETRRHPNGVFESQSVRAN